MAIPAPLSRKLRDALGSDASELLVTWLEEMRAEHKAALAHIDERFDRLDRRFDRVELRLDGVDKRLDGVDKRLVGVDKRLDGLDQRITDVTVRVAEVKSDLMKWSFVFWCGAVAAIAALAGVLRT